ncbi:MAG: hypothetical protein ACI4EI_07900 [Muricoprocola sp.]
MLTLLFVIWVFYVTFKLCLFAIRAGWGIFKIVLSVVFFPLVILGLLVAGIIKLTIPVLVIIGLFTVASGLFGKRG